MFASGRTHILRHGGVGSRHVPQPLPRAFRAQQQAEDERKLERILAQTAKLEPSDAAGATSGGDESAPQGAARGAADVRGRKWGEKPCLP